MNGGQKCLLMSSDKSEAGERKESSVYLEKKQCREFDGDKQKCF